ncbi:MAG: sigma-54-dependent Fis family transcriptional regulator [Nitrospirae bacterium]|nr:sigma-54-dependent Fis family transcriptional regulator [Nitrospirota bacterium]
MPSKINKSILIIDDDRIFCDVLRDYLIDNSLEVITAHSGEKGLRICSERKIDVVLLDQKLPDGEGHLLCPSILKYNEQTKIIFITAYPTFDNAVKAIKAGAYDYLSKPFELEELKLTVDRAFRTLDLEKTEQIQNYKNAREIEETVLIGSSSGLAEVKKLIESASSVDAPVLITGETGTGKNLIAKAIHYSSPYRDAPFVSINCSAIPDTLIEAELFGYEKGAFTGALTTRKGIFEMAEGGTLLLDEIGEMPQHLQPKLLSVLDDKKIKRLGSDYIRHVNVRIIATTNIDLENMIKDKKFRQDLYYRLSVIRIHIPPLRERRQDIPELCDYFISKLARGQTVRLPDSEVARLMEYDWPGNVRELKNVLERAIILHKGPLIRPSELLGMPLAPEPLGSPYATSSREEFLTLEDVERNYIRYALHKFSGNYTRTARALKISLSTLKRKIKRYGIV